MARDGGDMEGEERREKVVVGCNRSCLRGFTGVVFPVEEMRGGVAAMVEGKMDRFGIIYQIWIHQIW